MTSPPPPTNPGDDGHAALESNVPGAVIPAAAGMLYVAQAQNTLNIIKSLTEKLQEQLDRIESSQHPDDLA